MHVDIFVQARMGSTRLPGKVMLPILDKPLLGYLIERLRQVKEADGFAILTTTNPQDDVIFNYCQEHKVDCYRGPEEDVLARYYYAALERKPDAIVRVTADCPLLDPEVTDRVIRTFRNAVPPYDYLSNSMEGTYPRGLDTEIFSLEALEKAFLEAKQPEEREHVTLYIYRHPKFFRIRDVPAPISLGHHRWTVDTPEDFALVRLILENLYPYKPRFRLEDVLALLGKHPEWSQINAHIKQKAFPPSQSKN